MRTKKFFVRHYKKISIILAIVLILTVGWITLFYNGDDTKAEVYIKNEDDEYVTRDDVRILEIVAQNGQQVFGFSIPGCEPITKDAINNYNKNISQIDCADLQNITGYKIAEKDSKLNASDGTIANAFNLNVLNDSMSANQIKVTVCQANQLTADLIHNADLIYINSNNYGCSNLLFYYDQFMNNGAAGIAKGNLGANYNTSIANQTNANEYILETFKKACGRNAVAKRLTAEDYKRLGIDNFKEYNLANYRSELSSKERGAFDSVTLTNLQPIKDMVEKVNGLQYSDAVRLINRSYNTKIVDEELKEKLYTALLKANLIDVLEVNKEAYIEMITTRKSSFKTYKKIQDEITLVAIAQRKLGYERLVYYKEQAMEYRNLDSERKKELRESILKMAVPEAESDLAEAYAIAFTEPTFNLTDKDDDSQCLADVKTLILQVNESEKMKAISLIADAPANEDSMNTLKANAELYFEVASLEGGLEGYVDYNLNAYIAKLESLVTVDPQALKTDGNFDIAKMNTVLMETVNTESQFKTDYLASDISWEMALELYEYAIDNEGALMYDTSLLSMLGNYNADEETNTCNMYKILLLMRQLQPNYCKSEILPKIDELGAYHPDGLNSDNSISAWYKDTFCDSTNESILNKTQIREPAVVGQTYAEDGTKGNIANYVYKHIYSFTGPQFFGGEKFTSSDTNFLSTNTATVDSSLQDDPTLPDDGRGIVNSSATIAKVIRYIMELELNFFDSYPINVLELQPMAGKSYWLEPGANGNYDRLQDLADNLGVSVDINASNYQEYFKVTYMSVKEFNTRYEDLTGIYDLIYMGVDTGYHLVDSSGRTTFKNPSGTSDNDGMKGFVYYGVGPKYSVPVYFKGSAAADYKNAGSNSILSSSDYDYWWENYGSRILSETSGKYVITSGSTYERASGNDLTVKSMNSLLKYVRSGYPILMDDRLFRADTGVDSKKPYVATDSKMYNFIRIIKQLGWNGLDFDGVSLGNISSQTLQGLEPSMGDIMDGVSADETIFKDGYNYSNIVQMKHAKNGKNPQNYPDVQKAFEGGLTYAMKRSTKVSFQLIQSPQQYQYRLNVTKVYAPGENDSSARVNTMPGWNGKGTFIDDTGDTKTYKYVIDVKTEVTKEWLEANYDYQIYLDKSGTGRFEDVDILTLDPTHTYKTFTDTSTGEKKLQIILQGRWPGDMEGYIPWRVVISKKDNPNNHYAHTGFSAFKVQNKKTIYLLWLIPDSTITLDFATAMAKASEIDVTNNPAGEYLISEYKIKMISLTYGQYLKMYNGVGSSTSFNSSNTKLTVRNVYFSDSTRALEFDLNRWAVTTNTADARYYRSNITSAEADALGNKEFDMIVFGFCDMYGGQNLGSVAALNDLKYFADAGHSIMFAHDNLSYPTSMNFVSGYKWSYYTSPLLRTMLGMDAYGAGFSKTDETKPENILARDNAKRYLLNYPATDLRGHSEMYTLINNSSSAHYSSNLYGTSCIAGMSGFENAIETKKVARMNQGQLTDYPYIIDENLNIAPTHGQYLGLNMEYADLTVWYTLAETSGSGTYSKYYRATKGDGANNFYIYSKDNITYTGAGHKPIDQASMEMKLFINTVVASIKAGNFAPEVLFPDAQSNANGDNVIDFYPEEEQGLIVSFRPIDYDSAQIPGVFTDCKIFIDLDGDGLYDPVKDIPLFVDGIRELVEPGKTDKIDLSAPILVNKQKYTFEIPRVILDNLKDKSGKTINIYDYPITIQLTDNGTKNNPANKTTISDNVWVAEAKLHNLR